MSEYTGSSRRRFLKTGVAAGLGMSALSGCIGGLGGGGGPTPLSLAFTVPIENISSLMAIPEIQDEMGNLGDVYELSVSRNSSTPDTLNQMASGEVDLGLLSSVSFANAVTQEAVPGNITLVATDFWDAHPDHYGFNVFSLPDSEVVDPEDMEGHTVATNATGTGTHAIYRKMFNEIGLTPGENVELVELGFPNMTSALQEGRIDAGMYPALFAGQGRANDFNLVFSSHDVWEPYPFAYITAANSSIDDKGDAITAWGEDYINLLDYMYDNRSTVVELAAEHFELPIEIVDGFFLTEYDYFREDPVTDIDRMQEVVEDLADLGFIDTFTAGDYIDNQYVQQ
ncbi:ABC transporter substrate-binding protein [Halobellus sp. GM3]|uniref:ABC transporter substrate-binding protein n=1 Tax=Halobellus sp. GM3 TaxID=3458410 RepID=UPI00403D950F